MTTTMKKKKRSKNLIYAMGYVRAPLDDTVEQILLLLLVSTGGARFISHGWCSLKVFKHHQLFLNIYQH
jgi:hypothetical protein